MTAPTIDAGEAVGLLFALVCILVGWVLLRMPRPGRPC